MIVTNLDSSNPTVEERRRERARHGHQLEQPELPFRDGAGLVKADVSQPSECLEGGGALQEQPVAP